MANYPNLFQPIKIGGVEVPNRIAMMPMGVFSPRLMNSKTGAYTKEGADYYIERAKGGTGLIVSGLVPIIPLPMLNPVNHPEEYVNEQKYLMDGIHAAGSKIFIQLTAMTGRSAHIHPGQEFMAQMVYKTPSPIQNVWNPNIKHAPMTKEDIKAYVNNFATAAALVKEAGGDGVEIHAVHEGYLLDQFAIAYFNHREDEYGGSLENRLRFPKEIVEAIKEKCGKDFPVSVRFSVKSYIKEFNRGALPGEEFEEKGRDISEAIEAAKLLESFGYDMLNCDNGSYDSWYWAHPPVYMPKACNLEDVKQIAKAVNIPVVCAGRFDDPELADKAIANGDIDMMGMGRPLLADPEITNKFKEGRLEDIRPCISCHMGCLSRIFQEIKDPDISCAVNPQCGREKSWEITPAETKKKVLVIGGGLGGMEAARISALRGHEVDLFEKNSELGGVFIAAAAPSFKDDDRKLLAWYKRQMELLPINVHMNTEVTKDMVEGYDEIFVATGATERKLPIPGFDAPNVTYAIDTLLNKNINGENIIVVGGGLTGCEIAIDLAKEGKKVTIVEMADTILNTKNLSAANYNMLLEMLDYYKINVMKKSVVESYADGVAKVKTHEINNTNCNGRALRMVCLGAEGEDHVKDIPADHIIVSVGYTANQSLYEEIKGEHTYLIGDAQKPTNIMDAIWKAYEIAMKL